MVGLTKDKSMETTCCWIENVIKVAAFSLIPQPAQSLENQQEDYFEEWRELIMSHFTINNSFL